MKTSLLFLSFALLLLIPNFVNRDINGNPAYNKIERFDPRLTSISSIKELEQYADDSAASQQISIYSEKYTALLAYIISCRFYHGFSHYRLNENWIAASAEKLLGYGLASIVDPEEIIKYPNAACSQQAIVMMAVLRNKNISYRKVGFPHHYALEAKINSKWYYFDPNMEPAISLSERLHQNWKGDNDKLKKYYSAKHGNVNWELGVGNKAIFGKPNEIPGKNAKMFHAFTNFLSKTLWCLPILFLFFAKRNSLAIRLRPIKSWIRPGPISEVYSA